MKKILNFHPFLFGLFPIFYIYSQRKETPFGSIQIPLVVILLSILALWLLLSLLIKDQEKKAISISIFLLFFFSFGYGYKTVKVFLPGTVENGYFFFFVIWIVLLAGSLFFILKIKKGLTTMNISFGVMAGTLVFFLLCDILPIGGWFGFAGFQPVNNKENLSKIQQKNLIPTKGLPNIYYIIIDGYGRADILKEFYQFDNQEFIHFLRQRGFFVAEKSRTNYPQTALSLASSLNFQYIDQLFKKKNTESDNRGPLAGLIRDNNLFYQLKQVNYSIITFSSGKSETEIRNGDQYLSPRWSFSEFQNLLINSTPLPLALKRTQYRLHRSRILFILKELEKLPVRSGPFLAFAHIIAPHPPFVLGESGEPLQPNRNFSLGDGDHFTQNASRAEYIKGYKKEVVFLNKRLKEVIQSILANSSTPPIIILQSDHGPGSYLEWHHPENTNLRERMSNFIACLLPGLGAPNLYPTITPVNIFRIVLNQFLGGNYPLLKDENYFASLGRPYKLVNVTNKID